MNDIININGVEIAKKFYNDKQVVTFKDVDMVHKKDDGTARKNFNNHKKEFFENVDFFKVPKNELSEYFTLNSTRGNPALPIILLTYKGYLMLAKTFTDEHSWQIQRMLVENYFDTKPEPQQLTIQEETALDFADRELKMMESMFNTVKIHHEIIKKHDDEIKELKEQVAKQNPDIYITPEEVTENLFVSPKTLYTTTSIGQAFGLSPRELNRLLYKYGVQTPKDNGWKLTEKYSGNDYTYQKYAYFNNKNERVLMTWWTIRGKAFICKFLKELGLKQTKQVKKYNRHGNKTRSKRKRV